MLSQIATKSRFFANLATFCVEGTPYSTVMSHLQRSPDANVREWARWLVSKAPGGVEASLKCRSDLFNSLDLGMVSVGETSGRLSEAFRYLSEYYVFIVRMWNQVYDGLKIPVFLLLGGTILLTILQVWITGGMHSLWKQSGFPLFFLVFAVLGIFLLMRFGIYEATKNIYADQFLRQIPVLGEILAKLAESRFAFAFSLCLQAKMSLLSALQLAGMASQSAVLQQAAQEAALFLAKEEEQTALGSVFERQEFWSPALQEALMPSLEASKIFATAQTLLEEATAQMEDFCDRIPKMAFFVVALFLAWKIFSLLFAFGTLLIKE